jgi:hypothetical protein
MPGGGNLPRFTGPIPKPAPPPPDPKPEPSETPPPPDSDPRQTADGPATPPILNTPNVPSPDPPVDAKRAVMNPYLYKCNKEQQARVKEAWNEAGLLAEAHDKWKPPGWISWGAYQPAMSMYLGSDSAKDTFWSGSPGPLKENILRQKGIHTYDSNWSPRWSYAYIYCDESSVPDKPDKPKKPECGNPRQPGKKVAAYTFSDDGYLWNAKYVVLCPRFFEKEIVSLADRVEEAKKNITLQKVTDSWRYVKARSLFHETYHWGPAEVSKPICDQKPEIYDGASVARLAKDKNVAGSKTNGMTHIPLFCILHLPFMAHPFLQPSPGP